MYRRARTVKTNTVMNTAAGKQKTCNLHSNTSLQRKVVHSDPCKLNNFLMHLFFIVLGVWKCSSKYNDRKIFRPPAVYYSSFTIDGD